MNLFEKYNLICEQGPPPGGNPMAAMMGAMGGGQQAQAPPSTEDQLFERVRNYPKINLIIQSLQQKGVSDSRILDEIYKKFEPEFVYFAKEIIQQANKPKPPAGPGGPGGMPGMPGGMPGGAGPVAEQFGGLNNRTLQAYFANEIAKNLPDEEPMTPRKPIDIAGGIDSGIYTINPDFVPGSRPDTIENFINNYLDAKKPDLELVNFDFTPGSGGRGRPAHFPLHPHIPGMTDEQMRVYRQDKRDRGDRGGGIR